MARRCAARRQQLGTGIRLIVSPHPAILEGTGLCRSINHQTFVGVIAIIPLCH